MQQNICSPAKDIKTFTFTDSTGEGTLQNAGVPQNRFCFNLPQLLLRIPDFEKNRFFEEVLQRALFQTLVITVVFKS